MQDIIGLGLREAGNGYGKHILGLHQNMISMPAAYIEHRPHASSEYAPTSHYVIVVNGQEVGSFHTQKEAKDTACAWGYRPVHVARERHLQDRRTPAHWRVDPC